MNQLQKLGFKLTMGSFLLTCLVLQSVQAQTTSEAQAQTQATSEQQAVNETPKKTDAPVERVEVIGSRIKRIAKEGVSAVKKMGSETMSSSANTTASDNLRDSNLATFGVSREQAGTSAAATATIGLRGLGETRTLVLLNGHRLPKDPSIEAVDLNFIPQAAIERIEVLKDGASALYGSDALGGVINIVTKKNFNGTLVSSKISGNEKPGGTAIGLSLLTGKQFEKSDVMVVLDMNHTDRILGKDREDTKDGLSTVGATARWGVGKDGSWKVQPGCPDDLRKNVGLNEICYFKYNEVASIRPEILQMTLLTDYNLRLDSGLKFYNRNILVSKEIDWNYAPAPGSFSGLSGTASQPTATKIAYRFVEGGNRDNKDDEKNFSTLFGFKKSLTSVWDMDLSLGYSQVNRYAKGIGGYLNYTTLENLIRSGAIDPLAPAGSRGDVSSAITEVWQKSKSDLTTLEAVTTGELGEINGSPIGVAAGISLVDERLTQQTDDLSANGEVIGSAGSNDSGQRKVSSAFVESSLPVTEALEVSLAGRVDNYSDFGTSFNPKLSMKFKANESTLLRGSLGTGFKAPTLSELYGASSDGNPTFIDRKICAQDASSCKAKQHHVLSGGNKDLKEEKAISASLGAVIQPNSQISFSMDAWYTKVSNKVGIDLEALTEAEQNGVDTSKYGVTIERDGTGAIDTITAPNLNLQEEEISGVDVNAEFVLSQNVLSHQLSFENDFSYILFNKLEGFPGAGKRDQIGEWEKPQWRNVAQMNLRNDKTSYTLAMRSIPGQNVNDFKVDRKVSDLTEFDLTAGYKYGKEGWLANAELKAGIKNILDAKQPLDIGSGDGGANIVSNALYDVNGRKLFLAFSQKY